MMGSVFVGGGNQYIQLVSRFLYCKLSTIVKNIPTLPPGASGFEPKTPQR